MNLVNKGKEPDSSYHFPKLMVIWINNSCFLDIHYIWWKRERMLCKSWVLSTQIQGENKTKHMWPEWLSQAEDNTHSGGSYVFLCIFNVSGFEWATEKQQQQMLPRSLNLFGYCSPQQPGIWTISGNSVVSTETLAVPVLLGAGPESPGSAKSYWFTHPHSFTVSSQERGHF